MITVAGLSTAATEARPRASRSRSSSSTRRAGLVAARGGREDDLGVDRVGVAARELTQNRAVRTRRPPRAQAREGAAAGRVLEVAEPGGPRGSSPSGIGR